MATSIRDDGELELKKFRESAKSALQDICKDYFNKTGTEVEIRKKNYGGWPAYNDLSREIHLEIIRNGSERISLLKESNVLLDIDINGLRYHWGDVNGVHIAGTYATVHDPSLEDLATKHLQKFSDKEGIHIEIQRRGY